jgi:hypothetical protein
MSTLFPKAKLRIKKDEQVFWHLKYQEHEIIVKYPPDYPQSPLDIIISPSVDALPYEIPCYFAPTAVFLAQLRISRENTQKLSQLEVAEDFSKHWYSNNQGRRRLQMDVAAVKSLVPDFRLLKTRDGAIAYQFKASRNGKISALILCPHNYPQDPPEVYITLKAEDLKISPQSIKDWPHQTSIGKVVEEILKVSEEVESSVSNLKERNTKKYFQPCSKICLNCGKENSEDANYCIYCGSIITHQNKKEHKEGEKLLQTKG